MHKSKKIVLSIAALFIIIFTIAYLIIVLVNASGLGSFRLTAKKNYILPTIPNACRQDLINASLNPNGNRRPIEFREYGNAWLWDSGKTMMYDSSILLNKECLDYLIQLMIVARPRIIMVFYDRATKSEVLVMQNYK